MGGECGGGIGDGRRMWRGDRGLEGNVEAQLGRGKRSKQAKMERGRVWDHTQDIV